MATWTPPPEPAMELEVSIPGPLKLRGLSYGDSSSPHKVLMLHGWMDNARTHHFTAPAWASAGFHAVALDLPGHGLSQHRPASDSYTAAGYASAVLDALTSLGWNGAFSLCSHSMGAGISSMVAGARHADLALLCVIEGIGMNVKAEADTPSALATSAEARAKLVAKAAGGGGGKVYKSRKDAVLARMATVARYPGSQSLSYHAACELIERGTAPVAAAAAGDATGAAQGYRFIHDARLMEPSPVYLTDGQMRGCLAAVRSPALCITASHGWPWPSGMMLGRLCSVADMEHHHIEGGHHCHLDDETGPTVAGIIADWLRRRKGDALARVEGAQPARGGSGSGKAGRGGSASSDSHSRFAMAHLPDPAPAAGSSPASSALAQGGLIGGAGASSDADAEAAARYLASATVAEGGATSAAAGPSSAAAAAADRTAGWTARHLFIGHTVPYAPSALTPTPAAGASVGAQRVHSYPHVMVIDKVAAAAAGAGPSGAAASQHVWSRLPDTVTCAPPSALLRAAGVTPFEFGAWAPRVFYDSLPTLESVTAAAASAAAAAAPAASAAGTGTAATTADVSARLTSRGDAY
jgi:pimeloyl-ACP methyl ester carboxylesterase